MFDNCPPSPPRPQPYAGGRLAFAPKGHLLSGLLQRHPWALGLLPAALLAALLPGLAQNAVLHFPDAAAEARYALWLNGRRAGIDLLLHAGWLLGGVALFVALRGHGDGAAADALPGSAVVRLPSGMQAQGMLAALAAAALLLPRVALALAAALRRRWYAAHRERALLAAHAAQAAGALLLRAAVARATAATSVNGSTPPPADAAWLLAAGLQVGCALLARVRFSSFVTAQLLAVAAAACAGHGARTTGIDVVIHYLRLLALGWCAPALVVFGLDVYSRYAFEVRHPPARAGGGGKGGAAAGEAWGKEAAATTSG